MNKTIGLIFLALSLTTLTACNTVLTQSAPPVLPSTIHDPLLLAGWTALYNHTEAIQLPDGTSLSGRDLAQLIIDQGIPLLWAPEDNNRHASYSLQTCQAGVCTKENQPIYFSPSLESPGTDHFYWLVECMAHEIYHEMQPFGQVSNTLFEEYSAYYLSTQISQLKWAQFKGYDALVPPSLIQWFTDHNLMYAYQDLELYPHKVLPMVKRVAPDNQVTQIPTDQVITFDTPSALDDLIKGTKRCIWLDSSGKVVCEPSR